MQFNIHEAKTQLSRLIKLALEGEEVIIAKRRKPLVRLVVLPVSGQAHAGHPPRAGPRMGADFDEPLTDFAKDQ